MVQFLKMIFHRVVLIALMLVLQLALIFFTVWKFNQYFIFLYTIGTVLGLALVLFIINDKSNPGYKIAWIVVIMLLPIFGALFYLLFGANHLSRREKAKYDSIEQKTKAATVQSQPVLDEIAALDGSAVVQSRYIERSSMSPPYKNTSSEYLPLGEIKFERMVQELKKARHYIFLEYFILQEGKMWNTILDILVQKAREGVDVRVLYDDMGSMMTLPYRYDRKLEKLGIKCRIFNPFLPVLTSRFNNRDHRKICVIDGHTGFTGGINLADEYINAYPKHGHWKDTAILLRGDAVWSLTVMFLTMWDLITKEDEDFEQYRPHIHQESVQETDGFVQPFTDNPLDGEATGETVYMNLISKAQRYVYITTPYLIIDNEMVTALSNAAKSGVDVRIITPHIPDKWYVHAVTRAYYEVLLESGVKIYEYAPGFIHAKTFAVDDEYGVVGTINLDYRSLYLHFECGVWLYRTNSVLQVRDDFLATQEKCQEITLEQARHVKWYRKAARSVLRMFAPLM